MADENIHFEKQATDGGRSLADDAVSNRSDDTALDESRNNVSTGRNGLSPEQAAESVDDETQFATAGESQQVPEDLTDDSQTIRSLEAEAVGEVADEASIDEQAVEEDEQPRGAPAPPVEIAD